MSKGMIVRGALTMSPVIYILFEGLYNDEFRIQWDELQPKAQEGYARLTELLEAAIESEMWKRLHTNPITCLCTIQGDERYANGHCLAFHTQQAIGIVHPDGRLTRGPWVL